MRITEEELIEVWKYYQYCCLPAIIMAKYAYFDYIDNIKDEKTFYRHETKQSINRIGKKLDVLPNRLMSVGNAYIRYMNILGDNIEEQFEEEEKELHRGIYISFRNAKMKPFDCLAAIHYISAMLQIASVTFSQCCTDLQQVMKKDYTELFYTYDLQGLADSWEKIVDKATVHYGYDKENKKVGTVNLNNPRCIKAIDAIRKKLADIDTLRTAMEKSYPWSPNYKEGIPYEKSADYFIVNSREQKAETKNSER